MEDKKTFSLKASESNLLIYTKQHLDAIFSGMISTIAMDRLAYKVTDKTKFELSADYTTVTISEVVEPEEESPIKVSEDGTSEKKKKTD